MKRFVIVLSLFALVGITACESTTAKTESGEAYSAEGRTAGSDDTTAATRTFNKVLRK